MTDGPAAAVTAAAAEIDLTQWTHTTSRTNLTLLHRGGDVLDETTATSAINWLLTTLTDPKTFRTRTSPTFVVDQQLIDTLAGVVPAAPPSNRLAVAKFVLALPAQHDQLTAISWARVTRALPASTWTTDLASRAAKIADAHHDALRLALLAVAATTEEAARQQLLAEIRDKSLDVLTAIGDVSALPDDVVEELIGMTESRITRQISQATQGAYRFGSHDAGEILAVLNITHPDIARWEPIYALLDEPRVSGHHKRKACDVLARGVDRLPADVRARLTEIASSMIAHPAPLADRLNNPPDTLGPAAVLTASLGSDVETTQTLLTKLLSGEVDHRVWATRLALHLAPPAAAGVLTPLAQDTEPSVRGAAASCLARLVADGSDHTLAISTLRQSMQDPGTLVPKSIAKTLANHLKPTPAAGDLLQHLTSHRSAFVRATVADCSQFVLGR